MDGSHVEPERPHDDLGAGGADPLAAAKRLARQRIAADRQRHPADLGTVFEALAARLFEPGFKAKAVVPDPAARRRFRLAVGATPRAYCDRQLLDTAVALVCGSDLPIAEIAAALGFDDLMSFRKWFKWRTGEAPLTMRTVRRQGPAAASRPAPVPESETPADAPWEFRDCRCAAAWGVSPERGAALVRKIREMYPALDDQPLSD